MRQAERDAGQRLGVATEERERIKGLEREVRELRQANEILRKAWRILRWRSSTTGRTLDGRREVVGVAMAVERDHLLPPAAEGFELAEVTFPLVDKRGCVIIKTNAYSVPARAGSRVEARVYPPQVERAEPLPPLPELAGDPITLNVPVHFALR